MPAEIQLYNILVQFWCYDMQTVSISDLRANLLKYLEKASLGEKISVTTNGRLLATISPPIQQREIAKKQLQQLALNAKIHDITTSLDDEWDALK
jgi:prevent-host-death family protein